MHAPMGHQLTLVLQKNLYSKNDNLLSIFSNLYSENVNLLSIFSNSKMHWAELPEYEYDEEESTASTQDIPIPSRLSRDVTTESMNTRSLL